jgi:hypothetical protein
MRRKPGWIAVAALLAPARFSIPASGKVKASLPPKAE